MELPRIKINYLNGTLGKVADSPDGLGVLICGATAVSSTFELNKVYSLTSLDDLRALGVTDENNARLSHHVKGFYKNAEYGTKCLIYGVNPELSLTQMCAKEDGVVRHLIDELNGSIRMVFVCCSKADSEATEGVAPDVLTAISPAQEVAEYATKSAYAPIFIILEGYGYNGKNLKDLRKERNNRVGVLVGDSDSLSTGAAMGVLAGRLSSIPVQRNIGRVKDGSLNVTSAFIGGKRIAEKNSAVRELYEKGYLTMRQYVGRTGYFFADDNLACSQEDDYAQITARRTIDKAYRIAYDALLNLMLDELELKADGTLQSPIITAMEQTVEDAINNQMTAFGELSADDNGGCICHIDPKQNIVSTSRIALTLKVRPYGYGRYFDVDLGFQVSNEK